MVGNLDLSKPVQTRDGQPVQLVATDLAGVWPYAGIASDGKAKKILTWHRDGSWVGIYHPDPNDLINVPILRRSEP